MTTQRTLTTVVTVLLAVPTAWFPGDVRRIRSEWSFLLLMTLAVGDSTTHDEY
jgi:ABC-type spermidine/putrescine transport system permease subunit I